MAPEYLRDDDGRPILVRGYAAAWNSISHPAPKLNDRACVILPGAFRDALLRPMRSLNCQAYHLDHAIMGSIRDQNLQVWEDSYGLAFQVGPLPCTPINANIVRSIVAGKIRGASTGTTGAEHAVQKIDGEDVIVVSRFELLYHLGPVSDPMDGSTGCWCSHEGLFDLPPRLRKLSELLAASQPRHDTGRALRKMTRAVARLSRRATPRAAAPRPQAQPPGPPLTIHEIYPATCGLSSVEFAEAALHEAHSRRLHKEQEAQRFAYQREKNKAQREAGATA